MGLVRQVYQRRLEQSGFAADAAQQQALMQLDRCAAAWQIWHEQEQQRQAKIQTLGGAFAALMRRWHKPTPLPKGVYLHGSVGRGKSFLMDCFFEAVPLPQKTRLHFHELMRAVHQESVRLSGTLNPLNVLAQRIGRRYHLICFDEFHLNSMAEAVILENLLQALHQHQVGLVMTSNFAPQEVYPDCLHRERLDAAIQFLRATMHVIHMQGAVDHRLAYLQEQKDAPVRLDIELEQMWQKLLATRGANPQSEPRPRAPCMITIAGRNIAMLRRCGRMAWFNFAALCDTPRSKDDFLELTQHFDCIFLQGVPEMGVTMAQQARRFTLLVDVLYDRHVQLYISTVVPVERLYVRGPLAHEFVRTVSRLNEMHSRAYREQAARTVDSSLA